MHCEVFEILNVKTRGNPIAVNLSPRNKQVVVVTAKIPLRQLPGLLRIHIHGIIHRLHGPQDGSLVQFKRTAVCHHDCRGNPVEPAGNAQHSGRRRVHRPLYPRRVIRLTRLRREISKHPRPALAENDSRQKR